MGSPKPGEGFWGEGDEKKDGEGKDEAYKYAESTNPTPNSSPLVRSPFVFLVLLRAAPDR